VIVVPSVSDADAARRFPGGVRAVKPYLRYVSVAPTPATV
jgi:hypothetical protein